MNCVIYMDLFFLINFWMNALVIFLVRQVIKTYYTIRCLIAAVIGAFGSCGIIVLYIKHNEVWVTIVLGLLLAMIMNLLAFGVNNLLWHLFLFLLSGSIVAGIFLQVMRVMGNSRGRDITTVIFVSVAAGVFCFLLEKKCRIRWKEEHMKAKTVLEFRDRKVFATALMDTGNRLYDPFFHKPVILVDERMMKEMINYCRAECPERMHYIPFHSVGKENGILEGIMFESVSIQWQEKKIKFSEVIAAATKESLFKGKDYQVIFHCGLFQEI